MELPRGGHSEIDRIAVDTTVGMVFSNAIAFFIILTTAAVLNAGGITNIQTAAQAAGALRPLAGELTFLLFALGIIGTGLLAIPVLAGSAARNAYLECRIKRHCCSADYDRNDDYHFKSKSNGTIGSMPVNPSPNPMMVAAAIIP